MTDAWGRWVFDAMAMDDTTNPKQSFDRAVAAWNSGDLPNYLELYSPSAVLHGYAPEPLSREGIVGFYQQIWDAFGELRLSIHEELWEEQARVAVRATLTGRHTGAFQGVSPTGAEIVLPTITIMHFTKGQVSERWSQADMLGLMVQLGAVPASA